MSPTKNAPSLLIEELAAEHPLRDGYPTAETIRKANDEAALSRAIEAYRFFYATVAAQAQFIGSTEAGLVPNRTFCILDTKPRHRILTANSDTPYGAINIDLREGPMVIELPPGPLIGMAFDLNQRWVADLGVPGPDAGNGGRHLLLPPAYQGDIPPGYFPSRSATYRLIVAVRSMPVQGDIKGSLERIHAIKVSPLSPSADGKDPEWIDLTSTSFDWTPVPFETNIKYWEVLHEVVGTEPACDAYRDYYGELALLGIEKGKPFSPDTRMRSILEQAATSGNLQMRVQAFADRRPERIVWTDRTWEWLALTEDGAFNTGSYIDLSAREKWFYQAIGASTVLFRRRAGQGSLYWSNYRDKSGAYLDGSLSYRLTVPQPVPGKLFWSVTVYDPDTRSQIQTAQGKAALRSLFELKDQGASGNPAELYFGPEAPAGHDEQWVRTLPGQGWFAVFRIYVPEPAAFSGSWRPGDFEQL